MAKEWYVVHTYSGYEGRVEKQLSLGIEQGRFRNSISDIKIPTESVIEIRNGKRRTVEKKFLPGYILMEIDFPDKEWKEVVTEIKSIQGVSGFTGQIGNEKPRAISLDEMRSILQKSGEIKTDRRIVTQTDFVEDEEVRIIDGPFGSFTGKIQEIDQDKGRMKVIVGIFGRNTPVEVGFQQVEKI